MNQVVVNTAPKVNLLDFDRQGLREFFTQIGEKPYRAEQVMKWSHGIPRVERATATKAAIAAPPRRSRNDVSAKARVSAPVAKI